MGVIILASAPGVDAKKAFKALKRINEYIEAQVAAGLPAVIQITNPEDYELLASPGTILRSSADFLEGEGTTQAQLRIDLAQY